MLESINETAAFLEQRMPFKPQVAIVLGSGLGNLAKDIHVQWSIPYEEIPHFPVSTVEGHQGRLLVGTMGGKEILAMQGRFHYYEGYSMQQVTFPVRVMKALGIQSLFLSNAAGGMHPDFRIGDLMMITDHINHFPEHPLRGKNYDALGPRFPDMKEAYSLRLRKLALDIAAEQGLNLRQGVYLGTSGPTYETPAEYAYFKSIGGHAVGMSTVPEVIVAKHSGMEVFALSVITDIGLEGQIVEVSHEDVQRAALEAEPKMTALFRELIKRS
jgi:purine-nucleoside phosphorylase